MDESAAPASSPSPTTSVPKVFGVLSIIFGSLVLAGGLMTSCMGFAFRGFSGFAEGLPTRGDEAVKVHEMMDYLGAVYGAIGYQGIVYVIFSAVLLAIGIGQLRYREWAGRWSVYWGIAGLVGVAVLVGIAMFLIGPAYEKMLHMAAAMPTRHGGAGMPSGFAAMFGKVMGGAMGISTVIFYAPYPILMLLFFTRPRVRAAMNR